MAALFQALGFRALVRIFRGEPREQPPDVKLPPEFYEATTMEERLRIAREHGKSG